MQSQKWQNDLCLFPRQTYTEKGGKRDGHVHALPNLEEGDGEHSTRNTSTEWDGVVGTITAP